MTTEVETTLLSDELLTECEELLPKLAADFSDRKLYAMNKPAGFPDTGYAAAFVGRTVNLDLRDALIAEGRWRGLGSIITFCIPATRDEALGATLHEGAHLLDLGPPCEPVSDPESAIKYRRFQRTVCALSFSGPLGDSKCMPAWYEHHGLAFIRRCLHLHHRAWNIGYEIGLPEIRFAGDRYDLSPAWCYLHAIGDEPRRMVNAAFEEIANEPAPREFQELFRNDFLDWSRDQRQQAQTENE